MDRGRELASLDEVELVRFRALARDLGARLHVDRLERASEAREAHAIEVAEVRNEPEETFERVIVVVGHGARRLAAQPMGQILPAGEYKDQLPSEDERDESRAPARLNARSEPRRRCTASRPPDMCPAAANSAALSICDPGAI